MQMESYPTKDSGRAGTPASHMHRYTSYLTTLRATNWSYRSRALVGRRPILDDSGPAADPVVDDPASDGASSELASPGVGEKAERRWEDDDDSAAGPCEDDRDDAVQRTELPFGVALPPDPAKRYPARRSRQAALLVQRMKCHDDVSVIWRRWPKEAAIDWSGGAERRRWSGSHVAGARPSCCLTPPSSGRSSCSACVCTESHATSLAWLASRPDQTDVTWMRCCCVSCRRACAHHAQVPAARGIWSRRVQAYRCAACGDALAVAECGTVAEHGLPGDESDRERRRGTGLRVSGGRGVEW